MRFSETISFFSGGKNDKNDTWGYDRENDNQSPVGGGGGGRARAGLWVERCAGGGGVKWEIICV